MTTGRKNILIVEDDDAIRALLVDVLTDEHHVAHAAPDGLAALTILEAWCPQLIILDQLMPRMDGATFRAEQRTRLAIAGIPVLLLSAARDLPVQAIALDVAATMPKPSTLDELLVVTARLLDGTISARDDDILVSQAWRTERG